MAGVGFDFNQVQASKSQLERARTAVVKAHEEIEGLRQSVILTGENLKTGWAGPAAVTFGQAMVGWDDDIKVVLQDLEATAANLGANATTYQAVDDEIKGQNFIQGLINR